jgi:hypothetical protein
MNAQIQVTMKPKIEPRSTYELEEMKPYRVVSVRDGFKDAELGDIVLRFPSRTGGYFVLNCTKQMMFFDRSSRDDRNSDFKCLRAHDVQQITFAIDYEDRP